MHYWNRDNFEGLLAIAAALEARPGFEALAEYCRLRERGLRSDAFAAMDRFLGQVSQWSPATQQASLDYVLQLALERHDCHGFLSQPLLRRFADPVLARWVAAEPTAIVPLRWQGLLGQRSDLLREVLARCPRDLAVRRRLLGHLVSNLDYATHHLHEGHFIGDQADAAADLAEAQALLASAPDPAALANEAAAIDAIARLLADWQGYCAAPEGRFPDWCAKRGRRHAWTTVVYYDVPPGQRDPPPGAPGNGIKEGA